MARDTNGLLKEDNSHAFLSFFALYFSTTDKCQKLTNQTASIGKSKTQAKRNEIMFIGPRCYNVYVQALLIFLFIYCVAKVKV